MSICHWRLMQTLNFDVGTKYGRWNDGLNLVLGCCLIGGMPKVVTAEQKCRYDSAFPQPRTPLPIASLPLFIPIVSIRSPLPPLAPNSIEFQASLVRPFAIYTR